MANVTPGYVFTGPTDPVTYTKLNLLAQPTVTIGANEVTLAMMATLAGPNYLLGRYSASSGNVQAIDLTTQGLGFYTGAGGTVTQLTNKSTGVTLNTMTGLITMNNAALNDATNVTFAVSNSKVVSTDHIVAMHASAGTAGAYQVWGNGVGSSTFNITVRNVSGGPLSEAIAIRFVVLKSVNS